MKCPHCKKNIDHDSKFCISCGNEIERGEGKINAGKNCAVGCMKGCTGWCIGFLFTAAVIISAIYVAYKHPYNLFKTSDKDIESAILQLSSEMNKTLPMKIDDTTNLVNTTASGKEFIYYYKVSGNRNLSQSNLDTSVKSNITLLDCTNYDTKRLLNDGVSLVYIYSDSNGKYIGKISVQKSDCK